MKTRETIGIVDELIPQFEMIKEQLEPFDKRLVDDGKFSIQDQNRLREIANTYAGIALEGQKKLPEDAPLLGGWPILVHRVGSSTTEVGKPWFEELKRAVEKDLGELGTYRKELLKRLGGSTGNSDH